MLLKVSWQFKSANYFWFLHVSCYVFSLYNDILLYFFLGGHIIAVSVSKKCRGTLCCSCLYSDDEVILHPSRRTYPSDCVSFLGVEIGWMLEFGVVWTRPRTEWVTLLNVVCCWISVGLVWYCTAIKWYNVSSDRLNAKYRLYYHWFFASNKLRRFKPVSKVDYLCKWTVSSLLVTVVEIV